MHGSKPHLHVGAHFIQFKINSQLVAFSRVKTLQGLYILNSNAPAVKESSDVHNEMLRLNTKLLQSIPKVHHHENHVTYYYFIVKRAINRC